MSVQRFKEAQEKDYAKALKEIQNGRKETHWVWYIFPQLRGLGHSAMADHYGLADIKEAQEYYHDPLLKKHLLEMSAALLSLDERDPVRIFGTIDVLKVRSSMTLFYEATGEKIFKEVLTRYYHGEEDEKTLRLLAHAH